MFNLNQKAEDGEPNKIVVKLPPGSSVEAVEVRWPTDAEWCERVRNIRVRHASTGRDFRKDSDNKPEMSAQLFRKICLNGHAETIDEAEALYVFDKLELSECIGVERIGHLFEIRLRVKGAITVHILKPPSQKRLLEYSRATDPVGTARNGKVELRTRLEPAGQLYDELVEKPADGYAAAVPIVHKDRVVAALIFEMESIAKKEWEEDFPEE